MNTEDRIKKLNAEIEDAINRKKKLEQKLSREKKKRIVDIFKI